MSSRESWPALIIRRRGNRFRWLCRLVEHPWIAEAERNRPVLRCRRCGERLELSPQPRHAARSLLGDRTTGRAAVDAVAAVVAGDEAGYGRATLALSADPYEGVKSLVLLSALTARGLSTTLGVPLGHCDSQVLGMIREIAVWAELDLLVEKAHDA